MGSDGDNYASYLLRLKRSERNGQPSWRASLESTRDGQKLEFNSVEALVAFVQDRFGQGQGGAPGRKEDQTMR